MEAILLYDIDFNFVTRENSLNPTWIFRRLPKMRSKSQFRGKKSNNAASHDELHAGLLKGGGDELVGFMHQSIYRIWLEEVMSTDWNISDLFPVKKTEDFAAYKIFTGVLSPPTTRY